MAQTPVVCYVEMFEVAIPWFGPALALRGRGLVGGLTHLLRFRSQPCLLLGIPSPLAPGLHSRMPLTLGRLGVLLGTTPVPPRVTFYQSPSPLPSPNHGPTTETLQEADGRPLPTLPPLHPPNFQTQQPLRHPLRGKV